MSFVTFSEYTQSGRGVSGPKQVNKSLIRQLKGMHNTNSNSERLINKKGNKKNQSWPKTLSMGYERAQRRKGP